MRLQDDHEDSSPTSGHSDESEDSGFLKYYQWALNDGKANKVQLTLCLDQIDATFNENL